MSQCLWQEESPGKPSKASKGNTHYAAPNLFNLFMTALIFRTKTHRDAASIEHSRFILQKDDDYVVRWRT